MIKVKDLKVGQMYKNAAGVFFHKSAEWYEKKLVNITSKQKEYRKKILTLKNRIETYLETNQLNIKSLKQAECTIILHEDESDVFIKRYPYVYQKKTLKVDPQYEKLVSEFMKYGSIYRNYTKIYIQTRADYKKYYPKEFSLKREW